MGGFFSKSCYYVLEPAAFATALGDHSLPQTAEDAQKRYKTYDYVIVGGGACGAVLANRLSENSDITVLLVEAGANHESSPFSKIPIAFSKHFGTPFDWHYYTTPQPGLKDRELFLPRGKLLGGCTSINAMMYHHCSPSDFDEWETLGAEGWGYKDLAPYFRKSEKFTPNASYPDVKPEERGDCGLWQTGFSYFTAIGHYFLKACVEVGIPMNPDINTPRGTLGSIKFPTFIDSKGQRSSTATAYLSKEVQSRKNLTIAIKTVTTRILFSEGTEPTAIGIEIGQAGSGDRFRIAARKEVILCAGTFNTPHILNLSGIGSKDELKKFSIKLMKDLPAVGKNLADHLGTGVLLRAKRHSSLNYMANPVWSLLAILYWRLTGKGPATSNLGESAAFARAKDTLPSGVNSVKSRDIIDATSGPGSPDIELIGVPAAYTSHGRVKPPRGVDVFSIASILLRPLSLGRVYLSSADPFVKPLIDPNFLSHPNDIKILTIGMRLALRIARANAFQPILRLKCYADDKTDFFWPGDADPDRITDEDLEEHIRRRSETLYHPVGTARIGKDEKDSVVNPELRVHGVTNLRIVDASIFPRQLSGHPTAPLVAIAEKAADMILKVQK